MNPSLASDPTMPVWTEPAPRARVAAIALLACAVAMVVGTVSYRWYTSGDVGIGLAGIQVCSAKLGGGCISMIYPTFMAAPIEAARLIGLVSGGLAILLAAHTGVELLRGRILSVKLKPLVFFLVVAEAAFVAFAVLVAGDGSTQASLGYGGFVAIAGAAGAGVVALALVRPAIEVPR
jgi:hypothetical protein